MKATVLIHLNVTIDIPADIAARQIESWTPEDDGRMVDLGLAAVDAAGSDWQDLIALAEVDSFDDPDAPTEPAWKAAHADVYRAANDLEPDLRGTPEWQATDDDPGETCPHCGAWPFSDAQAVADHVEQWRCDVTCAYLNLIDAIGIGFHPDTRGADYVNLPDGYSAERVDSIVDAMFALAHDGGDHDPYEIAVDRLHALMRSEDGAR